MERQGAPLSARELARLREVLLEASACCRAVVESNRCTESSVARRLAQLEARIAEAERLLAERLE